MQIFINRLLKKSKFPCNNGCVFSFDADNVIIQVGDQEIILMAEEFLKIAKLLQ